MAIPFDAKRIAVNHGIGPDLLLVGGSGIQTRRIAVNASGTREPAIATKAAKSSAEFHCGAINNDTACVARILAEGNPAILGISFFDANNFAVTRSNVQLPSMPRAVVAVDGNRFAVCYAKNGQGFVGVYDANGQRVQEYNTGGIIADACYAGTNRVAVLTQTGHVRVLDVATGNSPAQIIFGANNGFGRIAYNRASNELAVTTNLGTSIASVATQNPFATSLPVGAVSLAFVADKLVAGYHKNAQTGAPHRISVYDLATSALLPDITTLAAPTDLAVIDGRLFAASSASGVDEITALSATPQPAPAPTPQPSPQPTDKGVIVTTRVVFGPAGPDGKRAVVSCTGDSQPVT